MHAPLPLQSTYAKGYGTVLDSGTTFLYLPSAAFSSFSSLVKAAAKAKGLSARDGPDKRVGEGKGNATAINVFVLLLAA